MIPACFKPSAIKGSADLDAADAVTACVAPFASPLPTTAVIPAPIISAAIPVAACLSVVNPSLLSWIL